MFEEGRFGGDEDVRRRVVEETLKREFEERRGSRFRRGQGERV